MTFLLALSLTLTAHALVRQHDDGQAVVREVVVEGISFGERVIEGQAYAVPQLTGVEDLAAVRYAEGEIEIPVVRFYVDAARHADIRVTVREVANKSHKLAPHELLPSLPSLEKIAGARYGVIRRKATKSNLPSHTVEEIGSVGGLKRFLVTLFPVQVVGRTVTLARSFVVTNRKPSATKVRGEGVVFIVGNKFKNSASLRTYQVARAAAGFDVQTLAAAPGRTAGQLREELRRLYASKPHMKYVVIVGDLADVAVPEGVTITGVSDHYFASVDKADYASDIATPDLMVGRLTVQTEAQLAAVLTKLTRYAATARTAAWVGRAAFLATDDQWQTAEGSHNYALDTHLKGRGYTGSFPAARQAGGDRIYAITHRAGNAEVMAALQEGRGIVNYSGHGATDLWDAPRMDQDDVRALRSDALPFVISNACITADFREDESFGETWLRAPKGAAMFWGSMDSTYWDEDDILEKRMYDGIFRQGKRTFGEITAHALAETYRHFGGRGHGGNYYLETYHMFGDPSLTFVAK